MWLAPYSCHLIFFLPTIGPSFRLVSRWNRDSNPRPRFVGGIAEWQDQYFTSTDIVYFQKRNYFLNTYEKNWESLSKKMLFFQFSRLRGRVVDNRQANLSLSLLVLSSSFKRNKLKKRNTFLKYKKNWFNFVVVVVVVVSEFMAVLQSSLFFKEGQKEEKKSFWIENYLMRTS